MNTLVQASIQQLRDKSVVAVQFPNTAELNRRFKQLPGARWSQTLKSWYVPDTAEYRQRFGLAGAAPAPPLATLAATCLQKGSLVCLEGKLAYREYTEEGGTQKWVTEIIADQLLMLDKKEKRNEAEAIDNERLPF